MTGKKPRATTATAPITVSDRAAALPVILTSALLGAFIVFGVGFAHSESVHNAAHDTRHAIGFPCH